MADNNTTPAADVLLGAAKVYRHEGKIFVVGFANETYGTPEEVADIEAAKTRAGELVAEQVSATISAEETAALEAQS